tara:strand:+ start:48 stop:1181 length:1134 start_codon:yes stop_codon:yes gene_type:complete
MNNLKDFLLSKNTEKNQIEIILSFAKSSVLIEKEINNYEKTNHIGIGRNKTGDIQKPIDIRCNNIIMTELNKLNNIFYAVSEEEENSKLMYNGNLFPFPENIYSVAFDPLDGSDNIISNGPLGTIFGIYSEKNNLHYSGGNLICSGYAIYSSVIIFVFTLGEHVYEFKFDKEKNIFLKTSNNLVIPSKPKKIINCNPGNMYKWREKDVNFFKWLTEENQKYTFRYSGCMVFDIHRILCEGGIFMYPGDYKNKNGKLRILYECFPLSFIIEAANGISIDGNIRLLNREIKTAHEKTPIYIGCKRDIVFYKYFEKILVQKSTFIIESFNGSGEDEVSVSEGEKIDTYKVLSDENWTRISKSNGKKGIVPTKCLYFHETY